MKARSLLILCGALGTAACTAGTVKTSVPEMTRYAPADEHFEGTVSYFDSGMGVWAAGRKDAYKRMYKYCGGSYKIVG